jgi:hypothetical protein
VSQALILLLSFDVAFTISEGLFSDSQMT